MLLSKKLINRLEEYQGLNPKPSDFDEFWDKSLEEMRAVQPNIEFIPSEFETSFANCYDMYFTGVKGARIHARYIKPKKADKPHPAILMFHGYGGDAGTWVDKLGYAAQGFSVFSMDCRGQGGYSQDINNVKGTTFRGHIVRGLDDSPENFVLRDIFLDTAQLAKIAMEMDDIDENRVGAYGASQGGGLTLACASLEPRISKVVPFSPFLCDYKKICETDVSQSAYAELKDYFRRFDPLHEREDEIFTKLGYIDVQHLTNRIKGEVMMGVGLLDSICLPESQYAAFNKINSPKKTVIYPDFGHEDLPGFDEKTFMFFKDL